MKPKELVKLALMEGIQDQDEAIRWIKTNHDYDIRPNLYHLFKNQLISQGFRKPIPVLSRIDLAKSLQQLVKQYGAEKVRDTLEIVEALS